MGNVGIIPARGQAVRYGGTLKELLPVSNGRVAIDSALVAMSMAGVDQIYIITTKDKAHFYAHRFSNEQYADMGIYPNIVTPHIDELVYGADLWATLSWALEQRGSKDGYTFIALADTIIPPTTFQTSAVYTGDAGIQFATFRTSEPHRFSIIQDGEILTKPDDLSKIHELPASAWGAITLAPPATAYIAGKKYNHYDTALRRAANIYGMTNYPLAYFYDIGSYQWYREYLINEGKN